MRKILPIFIYIFFSTSIIFSHELWMFTDNFHPNEGKQIKLSICSGHYFPKSNFKIKKSLIKDVFIKNSEKRSDIIIKSEGKHWESSFSIKNGSTHLAVFTLVKKGKTEPFFWGRALIEPLNPTRKKSEYITGEGLEIILLNNISQLKENDTLELKALFNGEPVKFNGKISVNGGKNIFLSSDNTEPVKLNKIKKGIYLITTSFKGKGCSLTFEIR